MQALGIANDEATREALRRVDKARWWFLSQAEKDGSGKLLNPELAFYGSLAMHLRDTFSRSEETAATDGEQITWNPDFVATLNDAQLRGLLLHETMHPAHQHLWRLPADEDGNIAGDHEINLTILGLRDKLRAQHGADYVGIDLPEPRCASAEFADMPCEEIYNTLSARRQKTGKSNGNPGPCGIFKSPANGDKPGDGDKPSDKPGNKPGKGDKPGKGTGTGDGESQNAPQPQQSGNSKDVQDKWTQAVIQAMQASQALGRGSGPADMVAMVDKIRSQDVDWRAELADFVKDSVSMLNDWSRCARRYSWQECILPSRKRDALATIVFFRDTSGSIHYEAGSTGAEFTALISSCVGETGCNAVVADIDDEIRAEYRLSPGDDCPATAKGRGGTDFCPAFDYVKKLEDEEGITVAGIVYLTDLDGGFPDGTCYSHSTHEPPSNPVLWLSVNNVKREAPFGRTINIKPGRFDADY